jgi:hypothetical protein
MKNILFICIILTFIITGCYNDSEETLFPQLSQCDSTLYSFKDQIYPLIDGNCNGCHTNQAPILTSYSNIKNNVDAIYNDINSGKMPQGGIKLNECLIKQFKKWKDNGMPNN